MHQRFCPEEEADVVRDEGGPMELAERVGNQGKEVIGPQAEEHHSKSQDDRDGRFV